MPVPAHRFATAYAGDCTPGVIGYRGLVSNEPFSIGVRGFDLSALGGGAGVDGPTLPDPAPSDASLRIAVGTLTEQRRSRVALAATRWIGVDRAKMPDAGAEGATEYGTFRHVFDDLDALGAGWFREGQHGDLLWRHCFGGQQIPRPDAILTALTKDHFAAFSDFNHRLAQAVKTNVRLLPMVFQAGSGTGQVTDGKPSRQHDVLIPAMWGWAAWYTDDTDWPAKSPNTSESLYQQFGLNVYNPDTGSVFTDHGFMRLAASRKAMGVAAFGEAVGMLLAEWEVTLAAEGLDLLDYVPYLEFGAEWDGSWTDGEAGLTTDDLTSAREYARFVGVLAVSIRAHWPRARFKASEIASNSLAHRWPEAALWLGEALSVGLPAEARVYNLCNALRSVLSEGVPAGTYVVLVPLVSPSALFVLLPLLLGSPTQLQLLLYTLEQLGGDVLEPVLAALVAGGGLTASEAFSIAATHDVLYLLWAQEDSGTTFPPTGAEVRASDLIHCVGIHWFLWDSAQYGYRNETYFQQQIVATIRLYIQDPCRESLGTEVAWAAGNVGFPSDSGVDHQNVNATQTYQAAMLARLLLTGVGLGADHLLWYSHMADLNSANLFANMGLRFDSGDDSFQASTDAFPKASWFAFQRLVRLLARTSKVEVLVNGDGGDPAGVVLLRLTASSTGYDPGELRGGEASGETFTHALVPWVDEFTIATSKGDLRDAADWLLNTSVRWARFTLTIGTTGAKGRPGQWRRMALAPGAMAAERTAGIPRGLSDRSDLGGSPGYAAASALPEWGDEDETRMTGFGHTTQVVSASRSSVDICVYPAEGRSNAGLVAYFTNRRRAELVEHG